MAGIALVTAQFVLIALLIWPWTTPAWSVWVMALLLAGAGIGLWTLAFNRPGNFNIRPEPKLHTRLVTGGPYAHVRHPMYVSVLLIGLAVVLLYLDWAKALCWIALFAVLAMKSDIEEKALQQRFPGYRDYASRVGRFFPKIASG